MHGYCHLHCLHCLNIDASPGIITHTYTQQFTNKQINYNQKTVTVTEALVLHPLLED